VLAAIAAKGVNELAYRRNHAARWVLRLSDGTEESHRRTQDGAEAVSPLLADLFSPGPRNASRAPVQRRKPGPPLFAVAPAFRQHGSQPSPGPRCRAGRI
jgi:hypothetical protein